MACPAGPNKFGPSLLCGQVDALEFYVARLQELVRQIRAAREQLRDRPEAAMPAAFVTFRGRATQVSGL